MRNPTLTLTVLFGTAVYAFPDDLPPVANQQVDFVKHIQPILRDRCFECHASGNEKSGLNLGIRARTLTGGDSGPVISPRKSPDSLLIQLVSGRDKDRIMPPAGERLSPHQIGLLRAWIDQGAKWPDGADVLNPKLDRARHHWAFQPLRNVELPPVQIFGILGMILSVLIVLGNVGLIVIGLTTA